MPTPNRVRHVVTPHGIQKICLPRAQLTSISLPPSFSAFYLISLRFIGTFIIAEADSDGDVRYSLEEGKILLVRAMPYLLFRK